VFNDALCETRAGQGLQRLVAAGGRPYFRAVTNRCAFRSLLLSLLLVVAMPSNAFHLRVSGMVSDMCSGAPLEAVWVNVFKNGKAQHRLRSDATGRYSVRLDNNAEYVIRFVLPGRVGKCYALDTRGGAWEGDRRTADLEVDVTLFEPVEGVDLELFDLPMGIARFNPMTGHVAWKADYERRVRPEAERLMDEVAQRLEALAGVSPENAHGGCRRWH